MRGVHGSPWCPRPALPHRHKGYRRNLIPNSFTAMTGSCALTLGFTGRHGGDLLIKTRFHTASEAAMPRSLPVGPVFFDIRPPKLQGRIGGARSSYLTPKGGADGQDARGPCSLPEHQVSVAMRGPNRSVLVFGRERLVMTLAALALLQAPIRSAVRQSIRSPGAID